MTHTNTQQEATTGNNRNIVSLTSEARNKAFYTHRRELENPEKTIGQPGQRVASTDRHVGAMRTLNNSILPVAVTDALVTQPSSTPVYILKQKHAQQDMQENTQADRQTDKLNKSVRNARATHTHRWTKQAGKVKVRTQKQTTLTGEGLLLVASVNCSSILSHLLLL